MNQNMDSAAPLGRFVWHDLMTTDVAAATSFYTGLFPEWNITTLPMEGGFDYHMLSTAGGEVGGMLELDEALGFPSHWISYLAVADCDTAIARVEQLGGACVLPVMEIASIGRMAIVHDGQGAYFKLFQMEFPRQLPEQPGVGQICGNELLTTDAGAAASFYGELCGWESQGVELPGIGPATLFKLNDIHCGRAVSIPQESEAPSNWLPYLAVDNTDARAARVAELGGPTYVEPRDIGTEGRFSIHADPTGAAFAIMQSM